jgi:hypothetical protein
MADHKRKPAKTTKFPKKFRMKLEKIVEAKAGRASEATREEAFDKIADVLGRELLTPGSVYATHTVIDEANFRLTSRHWIQPIDKLRYLSVPAPWLPETPASS